MAVTRSHDVPKVGKKIKFLEDDFAGNDGRHTVEEEDVKSQSEDIESNSDSEDDLDDAPEEESTSTAKQSIIERERKQRELEQKAREADREKRREKDLQNQLQQQSKKQKKLARKEDEEELPEFLPEDIFEPVESQPSGKHLKAEELDEIDQKLMRQKMKEEKLKSIKNSKKLSIKKGPINVQVQSFNINKKVVPRAEAKIVDAREKWLKRKSLNKK